MPPNTVSLICFRWGLELIIPEICLPPSNDGERIKALLDTGKCPFKPDKSSGEVPLGCLEKQTNKHTRTEHREGQEMFRKEKGEGMFYCGRRKAESQNDTAEKKHQRWRGLSVALLLSGDLEPCWKEVLEHSRAPEQQVLIFSTHYFTSALSCSTQVPLSV